MNTWPWIASDLEFVVALSLLLVASAVFWKRTTSKLFLLAGGGFLVGLLGTGYRVCVLAYSGLICEAGAEKMAQFIDCVNRHAATGSAIGGIGLVVAGVALLLRALKSTRSNLG
jgi:hypothetical protein